MFKNLILFTGLALISSSTLASAVGDLTTDQKRQTVERMNQLLNKHYVSPQLAKKLEEQLLDDFEAGKFKDISDKEVFAEALTQWLQLKGRDKHLRVYSNDSVDKKPTAREKINKRLLKEIHFANPSQGIVEVKKLDGNIGYLDLYGFRPLPVAKKYIDSAMNLLNNSSAIIIDLRNNEGGAPDTVQYLSSYFFEEPILLNSIYFRESNETKEFHVLETVGGEKMANTPLYILTSKLTFSAAEEFAYNMLTQKRAYLIGEVSKGGANPGSVYPVNNSFRMFISNGKAINPITKTNWETVGVKPHIEVPAERALHEAISLVSTELSRKWKAKKAKKKEDLDSLFSLLDTIKKQDVSYKELSSNYKSNLTKLLDEVGFDRYSFVELGYELLGEFPLSSALIFEACTEKYSSFGYLYSFRAKALMKANELIAAKAVLKTGIERAMSDKDKERLRNELAVIIQNT